MKTWSTTLVTAATADPVTLAEAKAHMRIATAITADDAMITALITAATERAQAITHRQYVTATYDMFLDRFYPEILIPFPPTQSITTVKYTDNAGTQQTLSSTEYKLDTNSEPARLREAYDATWPTTRTETEAVEIRFVCGYGAASTVPESVKLAIKMMVAHWYENAEASSTMKLEEIPMGVDKLLWQDRVMAF